MVIRDLDVIGIAVSPLEADAPLVVHSETVLPCPLTFEFLEAIRGWNASRIQLCGGGDQCQFARRLIQPSAQPQRTRVHTPIRINRVLHAGEQGAQPGVRDHFLVRIVFADLQVTAAMAVIQIAQAVAQR